MSRFVEKNCFVLIVEDKLSQVSKVFVELFFQLRN